MYESFLAGASLCYDVAVGSVVSGVGVICLPGIFNLFFLSLSPLIPLATIGCVATAIASFCNFLLSFGACYASAC